MEFLSQSRRRSSTRNVPGGEERGETDVFAGYRIAGFYYLKVLKDNPTQEPERELKVNSKGDDHNPYHKKEARKMSSFVTGSKSV